MTDLALMTWNVRYFGHATGGLRATDAGMRRMAWVVAGMRDLPDVIALQEVEAESLRGGSGGHQLERFARHLGSALAGHRHAHGYRALYFPAHRYAVRRTALYTTGLAVLVRDHLEVEGAEPHDITAVRLRAFGRLKQRRLAVHVRIRVPGASAPLDLVNTHLSLPAFLEVGPHRVPDRMGHGSNQLDEVERLIALADRAGPNTVVVGDFNSLPGSPVYERIVGAGWVDAFAAGRAPAALERVGTASFLHLRMHLDHVFSRPGVRWRRMRAADLDHGPFRGLSDHAPKVGSLALG